MLVSVVLPAYNAELYLKEAIDSILAQTFTDFELIILNDGSIDRTEEIILSYQDERIVYIKNEKNLGLIGTLNKGMDLAKGKYIARMDADDICFPERFEKQVRFLEENLEYVICGTSGYRFYNNLSERRNFNVPLSDDHIRARLFFNTGFIHPSVMFRREVIVDNQLIFNNEYKYAEDYFFWMDILKYGKGVNLKEKLIYYRVLDNSQTAVGNSNLELRKKIIGKIHKRYFYEYNVLASDREIELNFYLTNIVRMNLLDFQKFDFKDIDGFLQKIILRFKDSGVNYNVVCEEVGRVYFALIYVKRDFILRNISVFFKIKWSLFFLGGMIFLRERFSR